MTRGRRLAALLIGALAVFCIGLGSKTIISGLRSAEVGDPAGIETSSIDLTTGGADATLSARGMLPGDAVTSAITIANSGRQPMTYAMSLGLASASGAALAGALVLTIKTVGSSCADFDGTTLFDGPLDQAAFGSQANGRSLPAATAEILCFRAALPCDTGNALQGAATTVTLTFGADLQAAVR
jgi:hypothetical protein